MDTYNSDLLMAKSTLFTPSTSVKVQNTSSNNK